MSYPSIPQKKTPSDLLVTVGTDIRAAPEVVFEVIEDIESFVRLEENVHKVTIIGDVKRGLGMKSRWEMHEPSNGPAWFCDEEIVHYDKPNQIAYIGENDDGKGYAGVHNLERKPDGTTRLVFNEVFHFPVDESIRQVVEGMVSNVKKESERRAGERRG
jgi:hypothetical protein